MKTSDINKKTITQVDVARKAGVSRSIVSYILNPGSRPVAPETRKKVLKAIAELDYRPNKYAQNLMKSQYNEVANKQFGLILADVFMLRRPYYADILAGIHSTAHENKHHIRFMRFFHDLKDPILFNELIHEEEISGLILLALDQSVVTANDKKLIKQIQERIQNTICVEWELEGLPSVNFSRSDAAYKACKHLISKGKKNILYIGPQDNRVSGYQQAILEKLGAEKLRKTYFGSNLSDGYNICQQIIEKRQLPEAMLGGTDEISMGILKSLNQNRIAVPKDIALISIDNIDMAEYASPPLTTINVETWQMGRTAVETLIQRAKNPSQIITQILLPTHLIERETC